MQILLAKPGDHIRFVYDDRDFIVLGSKNHGNCNKTALGKNYIRFMAF